jgi:hypothetical protein
VTDTRGTEGKLADITGPGITDRWGVTCADLGASVIAPNGTLVSVFGDTFSGNRVGEGDWRSPVILIGTGDAGHPITYHRAGGASPDFAQQLWPYTHRAGRRGRPRQGISTVIPSDLLQVGRRRRPGGVAVAHRPRMALSGNAIPRDAARYEPGSPASRPIERLGVDHYHGASAHPR